VAPAGLIQILKITSPDHGTLRFCIPTDAASAAFSDVGVRFLTFRWLSPVEGPADGWGPPLSPGSGPGIWT
jgi:hypothetical protein